jgi:hypothetical protein
MGERIELPPFGELAGALRLTTERLAHELAHPQEAAPDWSSMEWDIARAVAVMQGISMALAQLLRWQGPEGWQDFLSRQSEKSPHRHRKIGGLLQRIDAAARQQSIPVVALKGSALRTLGLFQDFSERPMGDVDLLVRPADLHAVACMLDHIGYALVLTKRRHVVFQPRDAASMAEFGESACNPIPIEVHTRISEELPASHVDITPRLWPLHVQPGINPYASHAALLSHLLLHCAGNMRAHALRLTQLRDIAKLAPKLAATDWQDLFDGADPWWMYPVLRMTERYFPASIPPAVLDTAHRHCPRRLRRAAGRMDLTTVSWSNLRINAFPGIEWSRSPLEALRFAKSRIAPSREALDELESAMKVLPGLQTIPWYGQGHLTRIMRWMFGRPPRVQTMRSVLDAMSSLPLTAPAPN